MRRKLARERLTQRQHISLAGEIDRHARAWKEARERGDVDDAAAMALETVQEAQRKGGEGARIQVDHLDLLGAAEIGRGSEQPEACTVDEDRGFEPACDELVGEARGPVVVGEVER